jgi:uncharacterized protein
MTKDELVSMATKYLLVASTEACSGKSATILGIADRLQAKGIKIAYIQPVVTDNERENSSRWRKQSNIRQNPPTTIGDYQLMAEALSLPSAQIGTPLLALDETKTLDRLTGVDRQDYTKLLQANVQLPGDLVTRRWCKSSGGKFIWAGYRKNCRRSQCGCTAGKPLSSNLLDRYPPNSPTTAW